MRPVILSLLMLLTAPCAHAQIWECTDPQTGAKELNNDPSSNKNKNCVRKISPINTVPASRSQQQPAQKSANFPSVDGDTQKQRDAERRLILERELGQEQRALDAARKQLAEQKEVRLGSEKNFARVEERLKPYEDRVRQHESNIESLKKELANVR